MNGRYLQVAYVGKYLTIKNILVLYNFSQHPPQKVIKSGKFSVTSKIVSDDDQHV